MGVLQPHDQQKGQSADEVQTKPRESLWHVAHNINQLSSGRLGHWAMFWEHHKDAAQLLSPPPSSPSLLLCSLLSPPSPTPPLLSQVGASWACYPNPTVVVAFVSLTRGPALYTCQGANESNKQEPGKKGGQASAVLLSLTGFLATALPWKLGNPQSASLMSDDALALMETLEKHLQREITCCLASVATRGRRHIQSVWVHSMKDLKRKYHLGTHNNWLW